MTDNIQAETWADKFGADYTDRNIFSPEELDKMYLEWYGVARSAMNDEFLGGLGIGDMKILEVGCNVGNQLRMLQKSGFKSLYGVELQEYAVEKAKSLTKGINIIQGMGSELPYKDGYFDTVFTSGVLIHISPESIGAVLDEVYRCTNRYIWGFEYYADQYTEINYLGNENLLWKTDFARLYMERFHGLSLVKEIKYKYLGEDNIDCMFLLEKR